MYVNPDGGLDGSDVNKSELSMIVILRYLDPTLLEPHKSVAKAEAPQYWLLLTFMKKRSELGLP